MYKLINYIRSVIWTAVFSVVLTIWAVLSALLTNDPFFSLTLAASAIALAVLSTKSTS